MTVPSRPEAASLLLSFDPPPWFVRHSRAVAEIAGWLGLAAARVGHAVDRRLVESAALLHDIDKLPAVRESAGVHGQPHGDGSAAWLAAHGYAQLADAVAAHPVVRLGDDGWWAAFRAAPLESRIVAYADKRAGQHLQTMDARFASWRRRYPAGSRADGASGWDDETIGRIRRRAGELEAEVCGAAGMRPGDVARLGWTAPALAAALNARGAAGARRGTRR